MAIDNHRDYPHRIITEDVEELLGTLHARAHTDYSRFKRDFINWLLTVGKRPERRDGYAVSTTRQTSHRVDALYEWKLEKEGRYTRDFTPDDADDFMYEMGEDRSRSDADLLTYVKAIKRLFKYCNYRDNTDYEWEKPFQLSEKPTRSRDRFRRDEFRELYEAALEHGTVKHYHACTPEERDRLKAYLAQRFEKPKDEITEEDFERANCWKVPSLLAVCLDTGLRPIEVGRAKIYWFDVDAAKMEIPKEDSTKSFENWSCGLSQRTCDALRNWIAERETYDQYQGREEMWLTRQGNPYGSSSLNYILDKLLEKTNIDPGDRELSWYSIRHGVATVWVNEFGIDKAKEQLRHKKADTTLGYTRNSGEDLRDHADVAW